MDENLEEPTKEGKKKNREGSISQDQWSEPKSGNFITRQKLHLRRKKTGAARSNTCRGWACLYMSDGVSLMSVISQRVGGRSCFSRWTTSFMVGRLEGKVSVHMTAKFSISTRSSWGPTSQRPSAKNSLCRPC